MWIEKERKKESKIDIKKERNWERDREWEREKID